MVLISYNNAPVTVRVRYQSLQVQLDMLYYLVSNNNMMLLGVTFPTYLLALINKFSALWSNNIICLSNIWIELTVFEMIQCNAVFPVKGTWAQANSPNILPNLEVSLHHAHEIKFKIGLINKKNCLFFTRDLFCNTRPLGTLLCIKCIVNNIPYLCELLS